MKEILKVTKKELKNININSLKEGTIIKVDNKYIIFVKYGEYDRASLCTTVSDAITLKELSCVAGVKGGRPYYIDNFISGNLDKD